ncbi:ATP-grasp domain-containing protein [Amycolatopsis sp. OK19-0408]|uniref:ATP-grasp domain-containing protein n=1 Tax=Amycolatopsis iheyensis TaxID=2945988 RepID=A0A9X2SHM8_9PSEU|nr:ATP-grasp domain-containing protein [Amycolatopsis iheyensis]MCR6482003.1 ATP-grasp domain-containing protein [Amycolatopsis iheyensis]
MSVVALIREARGHWVGEVAAAVHAAGHRAVLFAPPVAAAERASLLTVVDDVVAVEDVYDASAVAARIRAELGNPAAVLTGSDGAIASTARVAELLGVARCPASVFALCANKFAVREVLGGTAFALISSVGEAASVAARVGFPAIVKPVNGAGSNLVRTVSSVAELAAAYELLATRLPESADPRYHRPLGTLDPAKTFLVEGFLDGPEYAVDVLIRDGVVEPVEILDKPLIDERKFELALSCPPAGLTAERAALVVAAVSRAVVALGLDNTVAHVEVIDDAERGPTIVEVNAGRPAGSIMPLLGKLRTGVDVFAELTALALGAPPPAREPAKLPIPLGMLILYASGSGTLTGIGGLDEVAALPEVVDVVTTVSPGQVLTDEQETYAVNLVVAGFADHDDLAALHAEASKLIRLEVS